MCDVNSVKFCEDPGAQQKQPKDWENRVVNEEQASGRAFRWLPMRVNDSHTKRLSLVASSQFCDMHLEAEAARGH